MVSHLVGCPKGRDYPQGRIHPCLFAPLPNPTPAPYIPSNPLGGHENAV